MTASESSYRLPAREPGWVVHTDVVVVGSGVAGLTLALRARRAGLRVHLVTKDRLDAGSTRWAQGGIAAALGVGDTPEEHLQDTLVAGVGLCEVPAVRALVTEGPAAVRRLIATGAEFDRGPDGEILLTREGGHHRNRIAHAGGDATGAEISRALLEALHSDTHPAHPDGPSVPPAGRAFQPNGLGGVPGSGRQDGESQSIEVIEHALVLDLLTDRQGNAAGVTLHVMGEGEHDGVGALHSRAVVLATGGLGQVYSATTNPPVTTGDGTALALRAGAAVADLEFVQFHPTVLYLGADARGRQPLISEAVRGEGAHLVDHDGTRFMTGQHPLAELAPRDIVAKAITRRMQETNTRHMYLDARHFGAAMWESRFPTILASCREHGIDPVTELIPVSPAAHYASGGIRTDLHGRSSVPGLYACGEAACTGVHGANRLASNSLLEGLVFAERIAEDLATRLAAGELPLRQPASHHPTRTQPLPPPDARERIQHLMTTGAGVLRSHKALTTTAQALTALTTPNPEGPGAAPAHRAVHPDGPGVAPAGRAVQPEGLGGVPGHGRQTVTNDKPVDPGIESWETANLHLLAQALVASALHRKETRGCHWREDYPTRDDSSARHRLIVTLNSAGTPEAHPGPPLPAEPTPADPLPTKTPR